MALHLLAFLSLISYLSISCSENNSWLIICCCRDMVILCA